MLSPTQPAAPRPGTPQAHGVDFADNERRIAARNSMARLAYEGRDPVDCIKCAGTGEGLFDGDRCLACRGRGEA